MAGSVKSSLESISRNWKEFDEKEFTRRISLVNWENIFQMDNLDVANNMLQEKFLAVLNELALKRRIQARSRRSQWVSSDTKRKMVLRDNWRCRAVTSNQEADWGQYRELKNQVNRDVKLDRKKHLEEVYKELNDKKDARGMFRMAKNLAGWKVGGTPEAFLTEGRLTRNPREMVELQMEAFSNKVKELIRKLPDPTGDPLTNLMEAFQRWEGKDEIQEMEIQPVGRSHILELLKKLGNSHAHGHDDMDGYTLKLAAESLAGPISHLVNLSIRKSNFANRWKIGRLIPLHNGGIKPPTDPLSFCPISLLPAISKVVEKVVQIQLVCHLEISNMWNINMHSYRKKLQYHNCTH